MKLNYIFMCFVFIIILIPYSVNAFLLPVGQKIPEFYKSGFGICERNIKIVSTGFNKISSFYNSGVINKGYAELTGKLVEFFFSSPAFAEDIRKPGAKEGTHNTEEKTKEDACNLHFMSLLAGYVMGLLSSLYGIWAYYRFYS